MTIAEWKQIIRPLLPAGQPWEFRGRLCYRLPVHRVVQGVLGEGSSFDRAIYIWRVSMPLFVPSKTMTLTWSKRMGVARKYYLNDPQALSAAIGAAFSSIGTEDDALIGIAAQAVQATANRKANEVAAYGQLLLGELSTAAEALARASTGIAGSPWEHEVIQRVQLISGLLDQQGRDSAIDQLDQWCEQTAGALGLRRSVDLHGQRSPNLHTQA